MAGVKTYNPKDVVVILGTEVISGFSEDDMITIKPVGDGITGYYGADGEVARSIDANNSLEVTITLAQTSDSNNTLMNLHLLDKETGGGLAPLSIKDLSGTTIAQASQAWVSNIPEVKFGKTIDSNEWTILTGQASTYIGGNN